MKKVSLFVMLGTMLAVGSLCTAERAAAQAVSTVVSFSPPNLPESIAIDNQGNIFVSMAPIHQVKKLAFDGTQSTLATLASGLLLGLAVDNEGNVYAALNSSPDVKGVWRITPSGDATLYAGIPGAGNRNGLAFDKVGNLYVTDPFTGTIYQIPPGGGSAQPWVTGDPLLQAGTACGFFPLPIGANGIAFNKHGDAFVMNTTKAQVVRIPVLPDRSAGTPELFVGPTCGLLWGADGPAFDNADNLYVAVNILNKIVRIDPDGNITTIADSGLFFPSAIAFGTGFALRKQIFITNFALFGGGTPGIVTLDVGVPGRPLP